MRKRAPKRHDPNRLFNADGFVHYRRTYDVREVYWGLAVVACLGLILGWVMHRGSTPDPRLFRSLIPPSRGPRKTRPSSTIMLNQAGSGGTKTERRDAKHGPMPQGLAPEGWRAGTQSRFNSENLYVKINGRAGFYKSFGFKALYCVALNRLKGSQSIDVELYDLGHGKNALGAYGGELGQGVESQRAGGTVSRIERNALYMAKGHHYLRAIGSDETPPTREALAHLRRVFFKAQNLGHSELPPAFKLFASLGIAPKEMTYIKENAFSFGFGRDVYAARLGKEGMQLFMVQTPSAAAAKALAKRYVDGFLSYGEEAESKGADGWIRDRYIGAFSTALAFGARVIGVRAAPKISQGTAQLRTLKQALGAESKATPNAALPQSSTGEHPAATAPPRPYGER